MNKNTAFLEVAVRVREFIRAEALVDSARQGFAGSARDAEFNHLALEQFALQYQHVQPYRCWCELKQLAPERITHWKDIPPAPAEAFKEYDFTSLAPEEREFVFYSSGTTQDRPSRHFHDAESLALYEASLLPWFKACCLGDLRPSGGAGLLRRVWFVALTPGPEDAPHSSLVRMFAVVCREYGSPDSLFAGRMDSAGSWRLEMGAALPALESAERTGRPVFLLGTALSYLHLLEELSTLGRRLDLPPGSRALETGGYKGKPRSLPKSELYQRLQGALGIPPRWILSEYGMSELSSQAYDCWLGAGDSASLTTPAPEERSLRFPPWARALVISPETGREVGEGQAGLLSVYDLANVRSIMAVQTQDVVAREGGGFRVLGRASRAERRGCSLLSA
jgi:hypothetical protein